MGEQSLAEWLGGAEPPEADAGGDPAGPDEDDARPSPRRRRVWLLALGVWAVLAVAFVAVRGLDEPATDAPAVATDHAGPLDQEVVGADRPATAGADGVGASPAGADAGAAPDAVGADGVGAIAAGADAGAAPSGARAAGPGRDPALSAMDALAIAAVHLAITGDYDGGVERYVEQAAAERRTPLETDTVVITVLAVVLEGSDGAWTARRPARYAVPVGTADSAPRLLGDPWPLPAPALDASGRPSGDADDDPATRDAVLVALDHAGYADVVVDGLERLGATLVRTAVTARPPGEPVARHLEIWLTGDSALHVLGVDQGDEP